MTIVAVDPGFTGALCFFNPDASIRSGLRWGVYDMPVTGEGTQKKVCAAEIARMVQRHAPDKAFLEMSWPRPTDGAIQGFRFGRSFGAVEALVSFCGMQPQYIAPQTWKRHYGLLGKKKDDSRLLARHLVPELFHHLERKKDHGRAEAILIALYADEFMCRNSKGDLINGTAAIQRRAGGDQRSHASR